MERNAVAQKGLSPKLVADLITSVIGFVLLAVVGDVDAELSAAIAKVVGFLVGAIFKPGRVVVEKVGLANDELLDARGPAGE